MQAIVDQPEVLTPLIKRTERNMGACIMSTPIVLPKGIQPRDSGQFNFSEAAHNVIDRPF